MRREQKKAILSDLKKKMVFLVGPRQIGKTWLSKDISKSYSNPLYLNYDSINDRKVIMSQGWLPDIDLLVLDEIHKMKKWKNYLKGIYDTKKDSMHILVTGSVKLETYREAGDSLAGRFFVHHLMPLSLKELQGTEYANNLNRLLQRGGYPEPFLAHDIEDSKRWRQNYIDSLLREDILDFADIEKYEVIRNVFEILRTKVGSGLSYANIANDLGVSPITVKKYIQILEALYIVYTIKPYTKKLSRSILKEPKLYFYDTGLIVGDESIVFENLVANSLLKATLGQNDMKGGRGSLMYVKNKEKKEVDFVRVSEIGEIIEYVEVKLSEDTLSKNIFYFTEKLPAKAVQVVKNIVYGRKVNDLVEIREAKDYLNSLFL